MLRETAKGMIRYGVGEMTFSMITDRALLSLYQNQDLERANDIVYTASPFVAAACTLYSNAMLNYIGNNWIEPKPASSEPDPFPSSFTSIMSTFLFAGAGSIMLQATSYVIESFSPPPPPSATEGQGQAPQQ